MFVAKGTAAGGSITCYPYSSSDYVYIDNAGLISGSEYRLTYNGSYRDGQLWNKNKIDLSSNFTISANPSDQTFTIQARHQTSGCTLKLREKSKFTESGG